MRETTSAWLVQDSPGGHVRRGFTLVELIVVVVILGIMAGVTLPRVFGNTSRQVDVECQTVQRLLSIAAERETLASEPVAIEYTESSATLRLLVRRRGAAFVSSRNAGGTGRAEDDWTPDRLVLPVTLVNTTLAGAWADGRALPRQGWRVVLSQSEPRPRVAMLVESKSIKTEGARDSGSRPAWQVTLGPDDAAAARTSVRAGLGGVPVAASRSIDLDQAGKGQESW